MLKSYSLPGHYHVFNFFLLGAQDFSFNDEVHSYMKKRIPMLKVVATIFCKSFTVDRIYFSKLDEHKL
jgi:hypothetical protein